MRRTTCIAAALLASTLLIGGCSDDDDSDADASEPAGSDEAVSDDSGDPFPEDVTLGYEGIGSIHVGMTPEQASRASGRDVTVPDPGEGESELCTYAEVEGAPETVRFMVQRDAETPWRINRIEIDEGGTVKTEKGIGNGSTEDDIKAAYNDDVRVEPNKYDPNDHDVIVDPDGTGGNAMLLLTDGTVVKSFRAGFEDAVFLVEGCS